MACSLPSTILAMNAGTVATVKNPQEDSFLHLKDIEITFLGRVPSSAIALRLRLDNTSHDFKPEARAKTISWNCGIYISRRSQLTLSTHRVKNGILNLFAEPVVTDIVLELGNPSVKENSVYSCAETRVRANFVFAESIDRCTFIDLVGKDVRSALASKVALLDRMKNVSAFAKVVLSVGKEVSELNDIAKVVFGLANRLFKVLQEQQEFQHMAVDLAELLDVKLHLTYIIPEKLRQGNIRKSLKDMLDVVEGTLNFIKINIDSHSLNGLLTRRKELTDLKAKLFAASEDLLLCLTANVFVMVSDVHQNMNDSILKEKLKPVLPARSSVDHFCLKGTREAPLEDMMNWAKSSCNSSSPYILQHVHGVAGSGKSSIASTICEKLETEKILAGAFFCKRDIEEQRDLRRILPSLSYTLALRHRIYKECLLNSLEDEPDITSRSAEQQLRVLFREPLAELARSEDQSKPFVFVVDALDECGDEVSRSRLANSLFQIAALSGWLKVLVTSRPLDDIMRSISLMDKEKVTSVDLSAIDSSADIKLYTRTSLKELVERYGLDESWLDEDTTEKLTRLASGLFIWTSTMVRFVRGQLDKDEAMDLVLSGGAASESLDDLYITVIEGGNSDDRNLTLKRTVLGVISTSARNRSLSIDGLHDFLQGTGKKVSKGTLVAVINHLRSVLYEDVSKGNVIRVCHPSFLDFLEDRGRSGVFWANKDEIHASMVETSLNLMKTNLRFNICGLESSYVANKDVGNLAQKIKDGIPESLIYSCLYWTAHFTEANSLTIEALVDKFLQSLEAIYWVEVLSLVDGIRIGLDALQRVIGFFKDNKLLCSLATNLHRLVSSSYDAISLSTPHLYVSALAWLPEKSPLRSMLSCMKSDTLIATGRNQDWPPMLWMYNIGGGVEQAKFSPDNKTIAACSTDGSVTVFDAKTGVVEMKLQGHDNVVFSVAFSPDGKRLVSGSADCSVVIWDLLTGDILGSPLTGHTATVTSVTYSPDGLFIASRSSDKSLRIWGAGSGDEIRVMEGCQGHGRLVYSLDGAKIVCCGMEGIVIRDAQSGELLDELTGIGHAFDVVYSHDGRLLASGSKDQSHGVNAVHVWDAETHAKIAKFNGHSGYIYSVSFSSDHSSLISTSDEGKIIRWDMSSLQMTGVASQESDINSAACSSGGHLFASVSGDGGIRVWDIDSLFKSESLTVSDNLWHITCSPEGSEIAAASSNGEIRIHSLDHGSLLRTMKGHTDGVNTVVYSPDGRFLASASDDCTVRVWDAVTGMELRKLKGHTKWIMNAFFLPDKEQIVSSSLDGTIRRWTYIDEEVTGGTILYSQTSAIRSMCLSQNGNVLAFGGEDGCIRFGDPSLETMKELQIETAAAIRSLSFSPDENYLASGSEDLIMRLWDLETQSEVMIFEGHADIVLSLSFSRDGRQLLSSSGDYTIRLWCVDTGEEIQQFTGHTHAVLRSVYSVDEKRIVSCSADGTIRIWNTGAEENDQYAMGDDGKALLLVLEGGWVKSNSGELLLWIPSEYCNGIEDTSDRCIPDNAPGHPVRLNWSKLVKGDNWTDVFVSGVGREIGES